MLEDVVLVNINKDYLAKVQSTDVDNRLRRLELAASRHNVLNSPLYDGRDEEFRTRFTGSEGFIDAYYDREGVILSTSEKYKNITLPEHIENSLLNEYPDWMVDQTSYVVLYDKDKATEMTYKLLLKKGKESKKLKLDANGRSKS
ncbi:hypothetical protein RBH94_12380 [Aestuariibaculum sp. YM273]|uniref:hypothetical protein n=1 Tax=Aestuariibaculum sp. YM273 TaxID=3070659 RepID=UPI0027DDB4F7|nr:hypothetical protein [Aestuariibaculum sp. YM273]WMI64853.1 hypothetical protein RBH94_12380 [Aestuariibaculum sp. YM273]